MDEPNVQVHIRPYQTHNLEPVASDDDGLYNPNLPLDRDEVLSDDFESDTEEATSPQRTTTWRIDHSKGDHKLKGEAHRDSNLLKGLTVHSP